jgi:hypothetical protein
MAEVRDSGLITAIIDLEDTTEVGTDARHLLLTVRFEDDTFVRMPMTAEAAGRVFRLLGAVHEKQPLPLPGPPIADDRMH